MDRLMRPSLTTKPGQQCGIACRPTGQAKALERGNAYRGFTRQLPNLEQACHALHRTAHRGPVGRAAIEALEVLLRLLPRHCWNDVPTLRVTNEVLAARLGCSVRQVQRHLAALHGHGIIAIEWGRANNRLRFDLHGYGGDGGRQAGIDLRPAIVFAHEQQELDQHVQAALADYHEMRRAVLAAIWAARLALLQRRAQPQPLLPELENGVDQLRREVRAVDRRARNAKASVDQIHAGADALGQITDRAKALRGQIAHHSRLHLEDEHGNPSPPEDRSDTQTTESNVVESVVQTVQREDRTGAAGEGDRTAEQDDELAPLIYRRWRALQAGADLVSAGELSELERHSRRRAGQFGVASRIVDDAIGQHGAMTVIGAILHVAALPTSARIRSRGALLATLLRRDRGHLTPDRFDRRPAAQGLSEPEALAIARRCAPSHQPHWIYIRWRTTQLRRGEPIHDPRRCLEGFARKLQRDHGRHAA